ncbi:DnaJ domain-containing protein [Candidatus Poribacteria bacterium]
MSESLDRHYRILGLDEHASRADVKRAYRRLALRYHPDKNPGNERRAARIFMAVNRAYSVLIDKAHVGESFEGVDEAKVYFRRHFYDLARRIDSTDYIYDAIHQEECDFFFKYQLEEVRCVKRSVIEARRIIDLVKKAVAKGYNTSGILEQHSEFFQKHGFEDQPEYDIHEELIAEYKMVIDEEPDNVEAHYSLGCIYEKQGMMDQALSEYQIASYIDPENTFAKSAVRRLRTKSRQTI